MEKVGVAKYNNTWPKFDPFYGSAGFALGQFGWDGRSTRGVNTIPLGAPIVSPLEPGRSTRGVNIPPQIVPF